MFLWRSILQFAWIFILVSSAMSSCPGSKSKDDATGASPDTAVRCLEDDEKPEEFTKNGLHVNQFEDQLRSLTSTSSQCFRTVTDDVGEITSPNWPKKSTEFLECEIDIVVKGTRRITLNFDEFQLVGGGDCMDKHNFVKVTDVSFNRTETICGSNNGFVFTSDGNHVSVVFQAETSNNMHVFHATYTVADKHGCGETFFLHSFGMFSHSIPDNNAEFGETETSCEMLFHAPPEQKVSITFEEIDALCDGPPLTLYDPLSRESTEICGLYRDVSWTSKGNELLVRYINGTTRDLTVAYESFRLEGSSEPLCKTAIREPSGHFSSPFSPPYYPTKAECWTLIHAGLDDVIQIVFEDFSVGETTTTEECAGDYVQINDVTTERLDRVCGTTYPFTWTSDSNEVLVVFSPSESRFTFPRFEATYKTLPRYESEGCFRFDEESSYKLVTSRGFPNALPSNKECQHLLHTAPGKNFVIEFTTFDLGENTPCHEQYLEVSDVITERTDTFCGVLPNFVWTSTSNEVMIRLVISNTSEEASQGFRLAYAELLQPSKQPQQAGCKSLFDASEGVITYPAPSTDTCSSLTPCDCLYVIHGRPDTYITIDFTEFALDDYINEDFPHSVVQISEPSATSAVPKVHTLRNKQPRFTWSSRINELHIRVIEYAETQAIRFSAGYKVVELEDSVEVSLIYLTDTHGDLSVPSDCHNKTDMCHFLIHAPPSDRILIRFDNVSFTAEHCRLNSLKVKDLLESTEQEICSDVSEFSLVSLGNELLLTFQRSGEGKVEANFSYITEPRPPENGNHLFLKGSQGEISSRTSSSTSLEPEISSDKESSVVIVVQPEERVVLRFKNLVLSNGGNVPLRVERELSKRQGSIVTDSTCLEGIQIKDLTTEEEELICGEADHYSWTSTTNAVQVKYNLSSAIASHGFRKTYNAIPRYDGSFITLGAASGFIVPNTRNDSYPPNNRQQWLIHAEPGDIISLVTNDFLIEESPGCTKDFVKIEDQYTGRTSIMCGSHQTAWVSESNEVLLTFESDGDVEEEGFTFSYEVIPDRYTGDCLHRFTSENGEFVFDEEEKSTAKLSSRVDVFCQFIFEVDPDRRLRMKISNLVMKECNIAEIIFVDLGTYRTTEVCQVEDTIGWTSDLNGVFLHVLSYQQELPSFVITWETVDRSNPAKCYIAITEERSVLDLSKLETLDRPNKCVISINYKPENRIIIALHDVTTTSANCSTLITVEDSVSGRISRLCDIGPSPYTWTSDSNEATITIEQLVEDGVTEGSKIYFNATYRPPKSECSKTLTAENGVLTSMNFPDIYPPNLNCSILLHADQNQRIRLTMEEFALEGNGSDCGHADFLKITDLSSLSTTEVCGRLHPFSLTSSGNELLLGFVSDGSLEMKGYRGVYEMQPPINSVEDCNVTLTEGSGQFSLPNFHAWYHLLPYVQCHYLIQARPTEKIVISFGDINLFSNEDCNDTYAVIRDLISSEDTLICGKLSPFDWTSSGNEVEIKFETFSPRTDHKLAASYRVVARDPPAVCDKTFSFMDVTNVISSDGFGEGGYQNDQDCTYVIEGRTNQVIEITFDSFDLEDSEACQFDYVELKTPSMKEGTRFCGTKPSFSWWSDGNLANISFHSDHVITRNGFMAQYKFVTPEVVVTPTGCNENLTAQSGNFTSPGFPGNYGYNIDCNYTIRVEGGDVVHITFNHFELETDVECKFDFIELTSLPNGRTVRYCGHQKQFNWTSSTNEVLVSFHSDGTGAFPGFAASYTAVRSSSVSTGGTELKLPVCPKRFEGSFGFFASPSFPDDYENNVDCRIDYTGSKGSRVIVNLLFLDLEYEPSCKFDYIQFIDVAAEQRSPRICGRSKGPSKWESVGNEVTIIFHTDEIVQRGGFYGLFSDVKA